MKTALYLLVAYVVVSFIASVVVAGEESDGAGLRALTGHLMIFYAAGFAVIYSARCLDSLAGEQTCVNGHRSSYLARFCPECGVTLGQRAGLEAGAD
jgi:hypothetical protein